jgi:hypothetical protein
LSSAGGIVLEGSYAYRSAVPRQVWHWLFDHADEEIDILAYAALFLARDDEMMRVLAAKAEQGVRVRILLGDPDSEDVVRHAMNDDVAARIRTALTLYRRLPGAEIRLHGTTLYASLFRGDDDLLVNPHVYAIRPEHSPVLHLGRRNEGKVSQVYLDSFERIWRDSKPIFGGADERL